MAVLREHYDNYELILVDDGSDDRTQATAAELLIEYECVRLLKLSRRFGVEVAISCGLDTAIGDFVVVMLPNTDPPGPIPSLVECCRSGTDILIGTRQERSGEPAWLRWGAASFYWVARQLFGIPLTRNATQFRVLSRQVVNAIARVPDKSRYLRLLGTYIGYESKTFVYQPLQRAPQRLTRDLSEAIAMGLQIIFVNSTSPLRLVALLCLLAGVINLIIVLVAAALLVASGPSWQGWQLVLLACSATFCILALAVAVLCEYVGLIYGKSRDWAAYYVTDEKNSAVLLADSERRNIVELPIEPPVECPLERASEA